MFDDKVCPICEAMRDPNSGKCLICDKDYKIISENGGAIELDKEKDYAFVIKGPASLKRTYIYSARGHFYVDLNKTACPISFRVKDDNWSLSPISVSFD